MPKLGETVFLETVVDGDDGSLFPQSRLFNQAGSELVASPVNLTYVDNGLYQGTFIYPDVERVRSVVTVFSDSGHTTEDELFSQDIHIYNRVRVTNEDIISNIKSIEELTGIIVESEELTGIIAINEELTGIVEEC